MKFRYDKDNEEFVVSESTRTEYHQMNLWLTRHVKGYKYMPAFKMGVWNGTQTYFRNGKINLGLWKEILKGCNEIGVSFTIDNKEDFPINRNITLNDVQKFCEEFFKDHKYKKDGKWESFIPYDHQIESAFKILKNRYCMAEVATSGGKTLMVSIVIFYTLKYINPNAKFLIIVPSITLVTQFYDDMLVNYYGENNMNESMDFYIEVEKKNGSILKLNPNDNVKTSNNETVKASELKEKGDIKKITKIKKEMPIRIEEVMSEKPRAWSGTSDANIYIGTYQSLEKWPKEFFKQFHTVICDEAHGSKSKTITTILHHTFGSAYSRFGVSGTFPEDDTSEILTIQSVLGPKITDVSALELKDKGIITPVQIKAIIMNHNDPDYGSRMTQIRKGGYGKEAFELEKDYIHASDKRTNFIKKIIGHCNNNTLLLFYTIEYGEKLFKILSEAFPDKNFHYIDGNISGKKRNEIKKIMDEKPDNQILIASYGCLSTGVSIKNLHNVIFADSFKSEQIIIQSIGRALRLYKSKKIATIFDLVDIFTPNDMNNILFTHFKERTKFYNKRSYPYKITKINL